MRTATAQLIILTGLLTAARGAEAPLPNPITNGGFETVGGAGSCPGWEFMGNVKADTGDAFEGTRALRLLRTADSQGETGLNRAWEIDSGRQGSMLAQRKGAIRFRYKAIDQARPGALSVQVIPMTDRPRESGGGRVRWSVPAAQVGDGQWHVGEFAYDYSESEEVKWVHVSARLTAPGELLLDAFEWVPEVDATPRITGLRFVETPGAEGRLGRVEATLVNLGSRPLPAGVARILLPAGLTSTDERIPTTPVPAGESGSLSWEVAGTREKPLYRIRVTVSAGGRQAGDDLLLERSVELIALRCARMMISPGEAVQVEAVAKNTGHTIVTSVPCKLDTPTGTSAVPVPLRVALRPGLEGPVAVWRLRVPFPASVVRLAVRAAGSGDSLETSLLAASPGVPPPGASKAVYAVATGGWHLLGSSTVRLALFPVSEGARGAYLQVRRGTGWQSTALIPTLGLLRTPQGEAALRFPQVEATGNGLTFSGVTRIGSTNWSAVCELRARPGSDVLSYRLRATPDRSAALLALEGPMLYAGDGLPARDDAVLPGLEWLVKGEVSSNALDIKPDHPDRIRYVPHPLKITIPVVGLRFGDVAVGLLWAPGPQQPSYSAAGSLSLVFASPDRFGGHASHVAGLMLPGVDRGLGENRRIARTPLPVAAGRSLIIEADLTAVAGAADALVPMDRWFEKYGVPSPLPFPRGDAVREIEFSLGAYGKDKALWNPEWNRWYSDIIVGFRPTADPCWELLMGAELTADPAAARRFRRLALDVLDVRPSEASSRLEYRADPETIRGAIRQGHTLAAGMSPDGNWPFAGKKAAERWPEDGVDYSKLGPAGAREVGLTASNTGAVLEAALLSGDKTLEGAGLQALEAMDRFRVPRAAQVWEVPVHTPDILASAKAVGAYLAGYRLTGNKAYLSQAVYWARTGLPFVYMWGPEEQPAVQGGTIPVFGATSYVLSWFAVAVQWNGLAYSQALYELSRYDNTFPWARVADNILVSGLYQQAVSGDRLAQWPDAVNFIKGRKGLHGQTPPCFRPTTLINQILSGMGIRRRPRNHLVKYGEERVVIRTPAAVTAAALREHDLSFRATFTAPQTGSVAVFSVAKPDRVLIAGRPIPEQAGLPTTEPAWRWRDREGLLEIHLPRPGSVEVGIQGAAPRSGQWTPARVKVIDFTFTRDRQDWVPAHDLLPFALKEGALETTTSGDDPYMIREGMRVPGREGDIIEVEMALTPGPEAVEANVYWGTVPGPGFSSDRRVGTACRRDGRFHTVRIPVGEHARWRDRTITSLRIDPLSGNKGTKVRIRSIRLKRAPGSQEE